MIVAVFANPYECVRALRELDQEGLLSTYATAVLAEDAQGDVVVKDVADRGPLETVVGLLTGRLVGLYAGQVGFAVAVGADAHNGVAYDLAKLGMPEDQLAEVRHALVPGRFAVIAEIWDEWVIPLGIRLEGAGARVFRVDEGGEHGRLQAASQA
jgi:uncharacterized membrane protein